MRPPRESTHCTARWWWRRCEEKKENTREMRQTIKLFNQLISSTFPFGVCISKQRISSKTQSNTIILFISRLAERMLSAFQWREKLGRTAKTHQTRWIIRKSLSTWENPLNALRVVRRGNCDRLESMSMCKVQTEPTKWRVREKKVKLFHITSDTTHSWLETFNLQSCYATLHFQNSVVCTWSASSTSKFT